MVFDLGSDRPGELAFYGSDSAALFTKEINESFKGTLALDYVSEPNGKFPPGFLNASPESQPWYGTMWTRDAGTFLRELVSWGYYQHACQVAQCVMDFAGTNGDGFIAFPRYFDPQKGRQSGSEVDGEAATIIAMVALWQRLPHDDPFRGRLYQFLHQASSPTRGIHHCLEHSPLIPGSGEFGSGGGYSICYNVVQNNLCALALLSTADLEAAAGDPAAAKEWRQDARTVLDNIGKYLVSTNGSWIWCVDAKTLQPDPAIINSVAMAGVGGLNGVAAMSADVCGFDPSRWPWPGTFLHGEKMFDELYNFPPRKAQFDKYGIWPQMNYQHKGLLTSPSYGQGYALQDMLLFDKLSMADHGLEFLAQTTYRAPGLVLSLDHYHYERRSPYYFYERMYSPDAQGKIQLTAGCGPLNLVNVSEPLKVARLIAGVDDTSLPEVRIIPRLPPSWSGYHLENWPIRTPRGVVRADVVLKKSAERTTFAIAVQAGGSIPELAVRLPAKAGAVWKHRSGVKAARIEIADR